MRSDAGRGSEEVAPGVRISSRNIVSGSVTAAIIKTGTARPIKTAKGHPLTLIQGVDVRTTCHRGTAWIDIEINGRRQYGHRSERQDSNDYRRPWTDYGTRGCFFFHARTHLAPCPSVLF